MRAISSGCIRVNKARQLATILLGDTGWKQDRIDAALKRGSNTICTNSERIPSIYIIKQLGSRRKCPSISRQIFIIMTKH